MNYVNRIEANEVVVIKSESAKAIRKDVNFNQMGLRYVGGIAYLSSSDYFDPMQIIAKGYWDHSSRPAQVKPGSIVVVMPSAGSLNGRDDYAIMMVAKDESVKVDSTDGDWHSISAA